MDAWQKDVIMIAVGWTLGLFTLPISKVILQPQENGKAMCLGGKYEQQLALNGQKLIGQYYFF